MASCEKFNNLTESNLPDAGIDGADIGVIVAYFVIILGVGIWVRISGIKSLRI